MTYHAENTVIGIRKYWPDVQALSGGGVTVNSTSITGLSGLTADKYRGGRMMILDGNQEGRVYSIVDNDTTSITVNRPELNESGNAVTTSDRVALFPYKGIPTTDPEWILVDSFDAPTPDIEWDELHAHRSGGLPYRFDSYQKKNNMSANLEITIQNGTMFPYIFGKVVDTGSAAGGGGSSTLSSDVYPGENIIPVASATNFGVNDYIRIGPADDGEIRQITAINTLDLTIDKPIRRKHDSSDTVVEMDNSAVYTHTFSPYYDEIYRQLPMVITTVYNNNTESGNLTMNYFVQATGWTVRNDGDKLKLSIPLMGFNFTYDYGSAAPSITPVEDNTLIYANSAITVNSVEDGKITTVEHTMDYGAEGRWYHNDEEDYYASEIVFGRSTQTVNMGVRIESDKWLDLLLGGSKFDCSSVYNFPTAGESLTINYYNCRPKSIPHNFPAGGPIEGNFDIMPQYFEFVLVDDEPYY